MDNLSTEFTQEGQGFDDALAAKSRTEQEEKVNSPESSTESNQVEQEEESSEESSPSASEAKPDENLPFHKHPRWKEVYSKAQKVDELEKELKAIREEKKSVQQPTSTPKPKWFTDIYGHDNEEAWKDYQSTRLQDIKEAEDRAFNRLKAEQQAEAERTAKANDYVEQSLAALADEGHKFDRNKLLKIMAEYRPVDESGLQWDFKRGLEIYNLLEKKPSASAKKNVADATMRSKADAGSNEDEVMTPSKLRKMGW